MRAGLCPFELRFTLRVDRFVLIASASSWLLRDYYFAKGSVSVSGFEPPESSLTHRLEKRTLGTLEIGPFSAR